MQVHDLGSLWVESDGLPIPLNGKRMASALSVLVVNLNDKVRTDVIVDAVWGATAPQRASAALDTLMWRLRRVIDPDRAARAASTVLRTEEHGYRLVMATETVDSWQFGASARAITQSPNAAPPEVAVELTAAALGLWRGRPYDDVDGEWLDPHRTRLLEQQLAVQQARIGALLESGQPEQAVAELVPIIAANRFAENLWCQRIVGLYQSGRASAALDAFTEIRRLLDTELGMTPGPELRLLQRQILTQDPALAGPSLSEPTRAVVSIPVHRTSLVGREADAEAVADLLAHHRLVSITGPMGCGKTRLAAAVAHQVQARFPDGVCFVDLSDVKDPSAVTDRVQQTLNIADAPGGSSADAVAAFAGPRSILIVLDNCEQIALSVGALATAVLERDGASRILLTSRRVLGEADEVVHRLRPLDPPTGSTSADLRASPAVTLFVERAASHGTTVDLDGPQGAEVARICAAVDGLPLELELAAARTRFFELHEIADSTNRHPMSLGSTVGQHRRAGEATLRESIDSSHEGLSEQERLAHRRLSVLASRFTLEAAVAACSGGLLTSDLVPNALIGLVRQSLLEATKPERPNGPSLFRQLVPIRAHAIQQLQASGEESGVAEALLRWISTTIAGGPRMGQSDGGTMDRRLDDNRRTITSVLENAIAAGPADDTLITLCRLVPYWWLDGNLGPETVRLITAAAGALGPDNSDFAAACAVAANASFLAIEQASPTDPGALLAAIGHLRCAPPELAVFAAELLLAVAAACWFGGEAAAATAAVEGVAAYGDQLDDDHLRVLAQALSCAAGLAIDPVAAGTAALVTLERSLAVGNSSAAIMCYHTLYMAALIAQDGPAGLPWTEAAIRLQVEIGQRNAADTLEARGSLFVLAGRPLDAVRCYGSANLQYSRLGRTWPQLPGTDDLVTLARSGLAPQEFDQAWASGERLAAGNLVDAWL